MTSQGGSVYNSRSSLDLAAYDDESRDGLSVRDNAHLVPVPAR